LKKSSVDNFNHSLELEVKVLSHPMEVGLAGVDDCNCSLVVIVDLVGSSLTNSNGAEQFSNADGLVNGMVNGIHLCLSG
jgi:hypothetical protein